MATKSKLLQAAAGTAAASGGAAGALNVEDLFSTYTYIGGTNPNYIDNGINLGVNNDGYSASFDGTSDGLLVGHQSDLTTFTVEGWFYVTSLGTNRAVFTLGRTDIEFYYRSASNNMAIYDSAAQTYSFTPSTNTWYHFALVRNSSNSVELFIDGVSKGSNTSSAVVSGDLVIGGYGASASESFKGLISNVRVSNNVRYTSNFTPPTSALSADSNTTVLTVQNKTFVDNSGNNESVSVIGNTVIEAAAPFTADSAEGGMVWLRSRGQANNHYLVDTERGAHRFISPDGTGAESGSSNQGVTEFNANGFTLEGTVKNIQTAGNEVVSWSWRKAPKFFDIQTWTGDSASDRAISHNLESTPGMIFVKRTNSSEDWAVWHKDVHANTTKVLYLNKTDALTTSTSIFGATNPSDTAFYVGNHPASNNLNDTYVAYIFAHNDGDAEFGPTADQDTIKCGSYTGTGTADLEIDLGFEPQFVIVKKTSGAGGGWAMWDNIRGISNYGTDRRIYANDSIQAEVSSGGDDIYLTATGFGIGVTYGYMNENGGEYIYMAIRRGPMAVPTDATTVFAPVLGTDTSDWKFDAGFPVDIHAYKQKDSGGSAFIFDRMRIGFYNKLNTADAAASFTADFDYMNYVDVGGSVVNGWMTWNWRRAPGFCAISVYKGTGSNRTVNHDLAAVPEMMWVKRTSAAEDWNVYHKDLAATEYMQLNNTSGKTSSNGTLRWNSTRPTDSVFSVGTHASINGSGDTYVGYLFGSVNGVSKVGSYVGDGNTGKQIDCGFTNGARFILIKAASSTGSWLVWDSERGIVTGNDPYFQLEDSNAQNTGGDNVDPYSAGFIVNGPGNNASGVTYIFYAIA